MKKIFISVIALLLFPIMVFAIADQAVLSIDVSIDGNTLKVAGLADEIEVDSDSATFTLSANSTLTIRSYDRLDLNNSLGIDVLCGDKYSEITVVGNSLGSSLVVSTGDTCQGTIGGGGISSGGVSIGTVTVPTTKSITSTGQVIATVSDGGKTTLTTDENTIAEVDLPSSAVSALTDIKIEKKAKETIVSSMPVPTNRNIVGKYVYNYTATVGAEIISTFNKNVMLTFTYTNSQISNLDESTLKIFYWKESSSQWVAMPTTVNSATNTLTAETNHFTYFAIMGLEYDFLAEEEIIEQEIIATGLSDGDLVRNPNAEGMAQFDIYIIKLINNKKFKRLIISPHVFESYAHFDKNGNGSPWDDVIDIDQDTMHEYTISELVRADGDTKVYKLTASGDTGSKQWLNMTAGAFNSQYDSDSVYTINNTDRNAYISM
ncbi:hypothetical protein ACFLZ0_01165 [Patescibacteria group bacterium]